MAKVYALVATVSGSSMVGQVKNVGVGLAIYIDGQLKFGGHF